jgi:importin subunit beta-1
LSEDDREHNNQLQALLVATLHYIIMSCDVEQIVPLADTIMQYLLQVLASKASLAAEEAFMACGKLMDKIEGRFDRYLEAFMPLLLAALKNAEDYQLCAAAVGACGDLCRAVEAKIMPYCDPVAEALLQALENPALKRDVKPPMLSLFGDMALAIGPHFVRYLQAPSRALVMLYQASRTVVDPDDEDMLEYLTDLHEAVIEAYTGIINGLTDGGDARILLQVEVAAGLNGVGGMVEFLSKVATSGPSDEVLKGAVGLVGDLAKALGKDAAPYLPAAMVTPLIQLCEQLTDDDDQPDAKAAEVAAFARQHLMAAHAP